MSHVEQAPQARSWQCALVGQPNCGKTALFNALTGLRRRVGNWSGVTVGCQSGACRGLSQPCDVVDLPGINTTYTHDRDSMAVDARVACDYLVHQDLTAVINVVDASRLEQHLYLTMQLCRLGVPMVVVLNMHDVALRRGMQIDAEALALCLGCPVVPVVATRRKGMAALKRAMEEAVTQARVPHVPFRLTASLREAEDAVTAMLVAHQKVEVHQARFGANRFLAGDQWVLQAWSPALRAEAQAVWDRAQLDCPDGSDIAMAEAAFEVCAELTSKVVTQVTPPQRRWTQSIDRVVLHPWLGLPFFLSVMYALFFFSINVGGAFQDFFDILSRSFLVDGVQHALQWLHAPAWLTALLAQGVGGGINTTVTFIPVIGALFLFLCFLEDCGYMARAAFVMDRLMVRLGLPGKSFIPMVVGFGCNVPAVMGARTLANPRDRILAVMMMPFMSCGARLAIFSVFAAAFFPRGGQDIIFLLYLLGVAVALFTGWILRRTVLPGKPAPLLMSMPDYHWPQLSALLRHAWSRLKAFLWRAGRTIVVVCMVLGLLQSVRWHDGALQPAQGKHSLLADVGRWATPVFEPMGIQPANWPATVGLATGVLAKEVVVGTLNHLYVRDDARTASPSVWQARASVHQALASVPANLSALSDAWKNPLVASEADHTMGRAAMGSMVLAFGSVAAALAYMLFVLLYFPCVSTMAVMRRELGWSWALFSMAWTTGLAYVLAVVLYQVLAVARVAPIAAAWHAALPLGVLVGVLLWMRRYAGRALKLGAV